MNKEELKNEINKFVESKKFKNIVYIFGSIFVLFFVFQAGMIAGFRKASFSRDWGNNYERNFGPMRKVPPFMRDDIGNLPNAHGAIGKIIKVEYPNIVVLDKDQTEKVVVINDQTNILERKEKVGKENLTLDKYIIVIGSPNSSGQIEAKLIRIIPSPEEMVKLNMSEFNNNKI
ncbi:MAG: hypothetical protein WCI91_00555 [Candidatus Nomurabacteria bacterium]